MLSAILCCATLFAVSNALPGGAPSQACGNLIPGNPPHGVVEQITPNPWVVDITGFDAVENSTDFTYTPGQTYTGKPLTNNYDATKKTKKTKTSEMIEYCCLSGDCLYNIFICMHTIM